MTVTFADFLVGLDARPNASGNQYSARCPAHEDRHPSLSIARGEIGVLLYCHRLCPFEAIAEALEGRGLWPVEIDRRARRSRVNAAVKRDVVEIMRRIEADLQFLDRTRADRYLTGRAITIRPESRYELTYHPRLFHGWSQTSWPAMVAVVRDVAGAVVDFHRTWLSFAEPITKAPGLDPPRAWLGSIVGHAVHLAPAGPVLLIGEGVETTLSAMQLYGLPGWAALDAGNLAKVVLPPFVGEVLICADNDDAGYQAAIAAAQRFRREGREVHVVRPERCNDFNDVLMLRQPAEVRP